MSAQGQPPIRPAPGPGVTVGEVMRYGFIDCSPQTPMAELARLMSEENVHSVIVDGLARGAGATEQLVWGIVSDLDLVAAAATERLGDEAGAFAGTEPVTVDPNEDIREAARLMAEHECSHLIVTDEQTRRPLGVVSTLDLARALASEAPLADRLAGR